MNTVTTPSTQGESQSAEMEMRPTGHRWASLSFNYSCMLL